MGGGIMSHYNTTNLTDPALTVRTQKNNRQRDIVLGFFQRHTELDPARCHNLYQVYYNMFTPITSIRRAISDLTKEGLLIKTDRMVKGMYGEKNHVWRIK